MNVRDKSWQEVIELLETAVFVTDAGYRVLYANSAGLDLVRGVSPDVRGKPLARIFAQLASFISPNDLPSSAHGQGNQLVQLTLPDGTSSIFHVSVKRSAQNDLGFVVALHKIPRDVQQDAITQRSSVGALMPTFLHELKNPLAAIATTVELLLEDLPQGSVRDELTAIFGEIRRMKLVLDGVGIVGRQVRSQTPWPVQESLLEACVILQPLAKRKGVLFETHIPKSAPLPFDASVLKAVLFNLVMNAIHACSEGQRIKVSSQVINNNLTITVEDTGHGMGKETLARCTELFFTTKPFGSGIGLALCQEVAQEGHGQLTIRSQEGAGTRVTFEVPLHVEKAEEPSRISAIGGEE